MSRPWESLLEVIRQNIAGWCQQTFCFQKFVDNSQQCFDFTPQAKFQPIIWIFTDSEGDGIKSRLPFKIFSTLWYISALVEDYEQKMF